MWSVTLTPDLSRSVSVGPFLEMKILILLKWKLGFTLIIHLMHSLVWLLLGKANPSAEQFCVSGPIFQNIHSETSKQQRLNWGWQLA